jgi:hypothetical protein
MEAWKAGHMAHTLVGTRENRQVVLMVVHLVRATGVEKAKHAAEGMALQRESSLAAYWELGWAD